MEPEGIQKLFEALGGKFLTPAAKIAKKLENTHGFLFDWDGVFNSGEKGAEMSSTYSETDSMGINLLRFSYWLKHGELPFMGIVTTQINESAFELAKREHFDAVYFTFKYKKEALTHIHEVHDIRANQMAFMMDDVLDISGAEIAGLSFMVRRSSSPLFAKYIEDKDLVDYITAHTGDQNSVREMCELIIGLSGTYEKVLEERVTFSENYQKFLDERDRIESKFYHKVDRKIIETII